MLISFIFLGFFSLLCIFGCGNEPNTYNRPNDEITPVPTSVTIAQIDLSADPEICRVNENTTITATVYDSEQNLVPGITVGFSADLGSVSTASVLTDQQGRALVVFTADDTEGVAQITATVSTVGDGEIQKQLSIRIEPLSPAGSIEYVFTEDTSQKVMGVKGSGLQENLEVTFLVKDSLGDPVADETEVRFELLGVSGDEYLSSDLGYTKNGFASTYINSGTVSGTVAVIAIVEVDDVKLKTASRDLVIWSCPPDARHFAISATKLNIAGRVWDWKSTEIAVGLADQYGNPVPRGTVVYFATECGTITASAWTNESGYAKATLSSSEPDPYDGFVTVMAYTVGQESYTDINSDGFYDPDDDDFDPDQDDYSEPYLDADMNWQYDEGELFWDEYPLFEHENQWDLNNGQWDKKLFVWDDIEIIFSGSPEIWIYDEAPNMSLFGKGSIQESPGSISQSTVLIPNDQSEDFYIVVADDLGNPLTLGTKITVELEEVSIDPNEGDCSFRLSGETDHTIKSFKPIKAKKLFKVEVYNKSTQGIECIVNLVVKVASTENGDEELRLKLSSQ